MGLLATLTVLVGGAGVVSAPAVGRHAAEDGRRARAAGAQVKGLDVPVTTTNAPDAPTTAPTAATARTSSESVVPGGTNPRPTTVPRAPAPTPPASTTATTTPAATTVATKPAAPPPADGLGPWADVDRRFQPGRTSWSNLGRGWSISVQIDNPAPVVGEAVHFDFTISSTVDPCCGVSALFTGAPAYSARSGGQCPAGGPQQSGTARFRAAVAFNQPGWQSFTVAALTGSCGIDVPRASLIGDIEVRPRPLHVQGSAPPELMIWAGSVQGHPGDRRWLGIGGDARDPDGGRIRSVTIDWGDGSPVDHPGDPLPPACTVQADGSVVTAAMRFSNVPHHYATPGSYVVTVTAVSTACDGISMPQSSSRSLTWSTESGLGTRFG